MNAVIQAESINLPAPVARRGISEAQWRTLMNNLFPGAKAESVVMVWDYCMARKLDPMKKPCHIVPMKVGDSWRDVVMPGIYEYRTTANRTGEYLGHSKPVYGPVGEFMGVSAPEWCELTVFRWNKVANQRCEFPVMVYFRECVGTRWDKEKRTAVVNARWEKAPIQMLTKCTEAAGLREAFPDELGGEQTAEEMEGRQVIEVIADPTNRVDPRGDTSNVDFELANGHVSAIADLLNQDKPEHEIAAQLREYDAQLSKFPELCSVVFDKLAERGVIKKSAYKAYLKVEAPET